MEACASSSLEKCLELTRFFIGTDGHGAHPLEQGLKAGANLGDHTPGDDSLADKVFTFSFIQASQGLPLMQNPRNV